MTENPTLLPAYVYEKDACQKCGEEKPAKDLRWFLGDLLCSYCVEAIYQGHGCFDRSLGTCPVCEAYEPIKKGLSF